MQVFVLIMMMALMLHDEQRWIQQPLFEGWTLVGAVLAPLVLLLGLEAVTCGQVRRRIDRDPADCGRALRSLDLVYTLTRPLMLILFVADLAFLGWLQWLRQEIHPDLLLPDLAAAAPTFAAVIASWWIYYPIDRRVRQMSLQRQIGGGYPVWPIWTRGQYLLFQIRHHLLLMLVPLVLLLGWVQIVEAWAAEQDRIRDYQSTLAAGGGLAIFLVAPLLIQGVWDTRPLPDGPLRQRLLALCRSYRVRTRELLLWRTWGGMVNAAVMGLIGPVRYILLTDALIELMSEEQVEAVMAHELGHVRRHHMPWLVICAFATLSLVMLAATGMVAGVEQVTGFSFANLAGWRGTAANAGGMAAIVVAWIIAFGYLSRRFERQADTFAAQHLARSNAPPTGAEPPKLVIDERSVHTVCGALLRVAELNNHPLDKRSWRHGSIQWRIDYLRSLAGVPIDRCSIDRHLRLLRWACAASLAILIAGDLLPRI